MRATPVQRPFVITFHATGTSYPLTPEEVSRLLDEYPLIYASKYRVILPGHNTPDSRQRVTIRPATVGGGPAFVIHK